jgi:hypothetical protein
MDGQYFGYQLHSTAGQNPQNEQKFISCSSFATPTESFKVGERSSA